MTRRVSRRRTYKRRTYRRKASRRTGRRTYSRRSSRRTSHRTYKRRTGRQVKRRTTRKNQRRVTQRKILVGGAEEEVPEAVVPGVEGLVNIKLLMIDFVDHSRNIPINDEGGHTNSVLFPMDVILFGAEYSEVDGEWKYYGYINQVEDFKPSLEDDQNGLFVRPERHIKETFVGKVVCFKLSDINREVSFSEKILRRHRGKAPEYAMRTMNILQGQTITLKNPIILGGYTVEIPETERDALPDKFRGQRCYKTDNQSSYEHITSDHILSVEQVSHTFEDRGVDQDRGLIVLQDVNTFIPFSYTGRGLPDMGVLHLVGDKLPIQYAKTLARVGRPYSSILHTHPEKQKYECILQKLLEERNKQIEDAVKFYTHGAERIEAEMKIPTLEITSDTIKNIGDDCAEEVSLDDIFRSISIYSELCKLIIRDLSIASIHDSLRALTNLQNLEITFAELVMVPDWVGQLPKLHRLKLAHNKIETLPESLFSEGAFPSLKELYIESNYGYGYDSERNFRSIRILTLPDSVGNLQGLEHLSLEYNHLEELPAWIGNLTSLKKLCLDGNQLRELPEKLFSKGNLPSLTDLNLSSNQLIELPESLGNLPNLQILWLNNNQLTALPESLGNLQNLNRLYLFNNQLTALPESLGNLQNLTELWLNNNQLTALPEGLFSEGKLPKLDVLHIEGNPLDDTTRDNFLTQNTRIRYISGR